MTPEQSKAARALLNLDMKSVCDQTPIGKRTLTEFERGSRQINFETMNKLKTFYMLKGIIFDNSIENAQSIKLNIVNIYKQNSDDKIRQKLEYVDILHTKNLYDDIYQIRQILDQAHRHVIFSQIFMTQVMAQNKKTQKQVANDINCSASFVNSVLKGKKIISQKMVDKIIDIYKIDVRPNELFFEGAIKRNIGDICRHVDKIMQLLEKIKQKNAI